MALRLSLASAFIIVFTAGVICAVVCPEQAIDLQHGEGGECTKCISTHFLADGKISGDLVALDANVIFVETVPSTSNSVVESFSILLPEEMVVHPPGQTITGVFRV